MLVVLVHKSNRAVLGIDIEQVTIVVNFDMPKGLAGKAGKADCETYLHRIGRTGRFGNVVFVEFMDSWKWIYLSFWFAGKSGIALNLIDSDESMDICRQIEDHFGKKILKIDTDNQEEIENLQS